MTNISIIGGSIAGCLSALVFQENGCNVRVIERSNASLTDRGAAVVIPHTLFSTLKSMQLIDHTTPHLNHTAYRFTAHRNGVDADALWELPTDVIALRWGHLYEQLRKRMDDSRYLSGASVATINEMDDGASLTLSDGTSINSDLVIAADGIHSVGRQHVWKDLPTHYSGYILWRGLIEEATMSRASALHDVYWAPYKGGLAGAYFIANSKGQTAVSQRTLNWGIYEKMPLNVLTTMVPGFSVAEASAWQLTDHARKHLAAIAEHQLPGALRDAVLNTGKPFMQPIVDIVPERLARGRTVLVGDAGAVLRPHSASGISKAVQNVLALSEHIKQAKDMNQAIAQWETGQLEILEQQSKLTQSLGAGMVTNAPDWDHMTSQQMPDWWENMLAGKTWFVNDERKNTTQT